MKQEFHGIRQIVHKDGNVWLTVNKDRRVTDTQAQIRPTLFTFSKIPDKILRLEKVVAALNRMGEPNWAQAAMICEEFRAKYSEACEWRRQHHVSLICDTHV